MLICSTPSVTRGQVLKPKAIPLIKIVDRIAEGGFSTVYKARDGEEFYAVKRIRQKRPFYNLRLRFHKWRNPLKPGLFGRMERQGVMLKEESRASIMREISAMSAAQHKYVITLLDSFKHLGSYWLVTEYCVCSLADLEGTKFDLEVEGTIFDQGLLPLPIVCHLMIPMFDAVAHLNSKGFMHLDIKGDNVLISSLGVPKLADFGLAERYPGEPVKVVHRHGTEEYMAPEMYLKEFYNFSYDTWSLGVTMLLSILSNVDEPLEIILNRAKEAENPQAEIEKNMYLLQGFEDTFQHLYGDLWLEFVQFLREIMIFDWSARPSPAQALELPFAQKVLKSWEEEENSSSFTKNKEALLQSLAGFRDN